MKLFVNGRFLTQQTSGVQYFAREICREIIKENSIELVILVPKNQQYESGEFAKHIIKTGLLKGHFWEQISLPLYFLKQKNALLLNLCNTGPVLIKKQIITIHDLAFIKNPSWFHPAFAKFYKFMIPLLTKKSQLIITVSETIKKEIINQYHVPEEKILVLGNKVSTNLIQVVNSKTFDHRLNPGDFFLMVGTQNNPRKNFDFVTPIFSEHFPDKIIVIAGGRHSSFKNTRDRKKINKNIIFLEYIDNEKMAWLFKNAKALINPSLYEGFGIPNLEAMAFGCPVICSNIPVFQEICKQSAFYFEPDNASSFIRCIEEDIEKETLKQEHIRSGKTIFEFYQDQKRAQILLNSIAL